MNETRTKKERKKPTMQRTNETNNWFFEKVNKIDKSLAKLTKIKKKPHVNKFPVMKRISQHMPMESRSLGTTLKTLQSKTWANKEKWKLL